jgi:predicted outer membrane protein
MRHHPPGSPFSAALFLSTTLLRLLRLGGHRPRLVIPAVVVLAACATVLMVPPQTRADGSFASDAVEAGAYTPIAHAASGAGIGVLLHGDGNAAPGSAGSSAATVDPKTGDAEKAATGGGPLGPADRDLLFRVKQAGLWEMPVGMMANARATTPRLREVGGMIAAEHQELDGIVNAAAAQLDVVLPDRPTAEQQGWMDEINAVGGAAFDERAVFLLRQAHGKVLPVLAQVRVGTRNSVIREFATQATTFVQRHIQYLESTGLVKFEQLPEPPVPGQQPALASQPATRDWPTLTIAAAVGALLTALIFLVRRTVAGARQKPTKTPRRQTRGQHAWR